MACLVVVALVTTGALYYFLQNYFVLFALLLILNMLLIRKYGKPTLSYVLFPFAAEWLKTDYRWRMNLKMVNDIKYNFKRAHEIIDNKMTAESHEVGWKLAVVSQMKDIKKVCEFVDLFAMVNRRLIEDDAEKKLKGKQTERYPISHDFIQITEHFELALELLKSIKILSISEVVCQKVDYKEKKGFSYCDVPLPFEQQPL